MKNMLGIALILLGVNYADAMTELPLVKKLKPDMVSLHYAAQQGDVKAVEELLVAELMLTNPMEED